MHYRNIRASIHPKRKKEAAHAFTLKQKDFGLTLSYFSLHEEFDLLPLNNLLVKQRTLVLPKVEGNQLSLFRVFDLTGLKKNQWGIFEPEASTKLKMEIKELKTIIVPGIAFDLNKQRIGYGGGFYDHLLSLIPQSIQTISPLFLEQLHPTPLPTEIHDIPVQFLEVF